MGAEIELGPSRRLALLLLAAHAFASVVVLSLPGPLPLRILLAAILLGQLGRSLERSAWQRGRDATIRLVCDDNGYVTTVSTQNDTKIWRLTKGGFAVRGLIILPLLASGGQRKNVVISSDATSAADFQRLLAWRRLA